MSAGGMAGRARLLAPRLLVPWVLALALVAVGVYGLTRADALRSTPSAQNAALVDASVTAEVQASVTQGLTRVLSFDPATPEATTAAADEVLAGDARDEFDTLYAGLAERADGERLLLTARVSSVAVQQLDGDTGRALVFLDQTSQAVDDDETSVSAAQLSVAVERSGSGWTITELTPR